MRPRRHNTTYYFSSLVSLRSSNICRLLLSKFVNTNFVYEDHWNTLFYHLSSWDATICLTEAYMLKNKDFYVLLLTTLISVHFFLPILFLDAPIFYYDYVVSYSLTFLIAFFCSRNKFKYQIIFLFLISIFIILLIQSSSVFRTGALGIEYITVPIFVFIIYLINSAVFKLLHYSK